MDSESFSTTILDIDSSLIGMKLLVSLTDIQKSQLDEFVKGLCTKLEYTPSENDFILIKIRILAHYNMKFMSNNENQYIDIIQHVYDYFKDKDEKDFELQVIDYMHGDTFIMSKNDEIVKSMKSNLNNELFEFIQSNKDTYASLINNMKKSTN